MIDTTRPHRRYDFSPDSTPSGEVHRRFENLGTRGWVCSSFSSNRKLISSGHKNKGNQVRENGNMQREYQFWVHCDHYDDLISRSLSLSFFFKVILQVRFILKLVSFTTIMGIQPSDASRFSPPHLIPGAEGALLFPTCHGRGWGPGSKHLRGSHAHP